MSDSVHQKLIIISCKSNTAEITEYTFPPCCSPSDHLFRLRHEPVSRSHLFPPYSPWREEKHWWEQGPNISGCSVRSWGQRAAEVCESTAERKLSTLAGAASCSDWDSPMVQVKDRRGSLPNCQENARGTISRQHSRSPWSHVLSQHAEPLSMKCWNFRQIPAWKGTAACAAFLESTVACPGPNAREQMETLLSIRHGDVSLLLTYGADSCPNIPGHYEYPAQPPDHNFYWVPPGKDAKVLQGSVGACLGLWPILNTPPTRT